MPRFPINGVYQDGAGNIVVSGNATFYDFKASDPSNPTVIATIYAAKTGGSAIATGVATTDSNGAYIAWVDDSDYNSGSIFTIVLSKSTHTDVPFHFSVPGLAPVIRSIVLRLEPGASAGTNINVTDISSTNGAYNIPTITDATDLAKSGSSGSFALNAGGTVITMDITEDITALLPAAFQMHDINSSSTSEMYVVAPLISSTSLLIRFIKRGSQALVDLTTILDAGDKCEVMFSFVTST